MFHLNQMNQVSRYLQLANAHAATVLIPLAVMEVCIYRYLGFKSNSILTF